MAHDSISDNPARIVPKKALVKPLCPELFSMSPKYIWTRFAFNIANSKPLWKYFREIMYEGDANPAVVCSTKPLLIAAYSYDCDCAVLIRYPDAYVERFRLERKTRLLSVNMYDPEPMDDVVPGPRNSGRWGAFMPRIADFLTDDNQACRRKLTTFSVDIWDHVYQCGVDYAKRFPHQARSDNPLVPGLVEY